MRKNLISIVFVIIVVIMLVTICFAGCDLFKKEYTIQYSDDSGTYQITVTKGQPYSIEHIPEREGYVFTGLFDQETGGNQYISANGSSLSTFEGKKNLILFPQFTPKKYKVNLDYQEAAVTGNRQTTVSFGKSFPALPTDLVLEHKTFVGWFTELNCEGLQVADQYGLIPENSVVNKTNFDLSKDSITLYAGFDDEKISVTCYFNAGMTPEILQIAYGTPVNQIVTKTRVDGKAPLTWSRTQGGEVFNGVVTESMTLYALEYAPVIDFDTNGGRAINSIVARSGAIISLPTPTKELAEFDHWEDLKGNKNTSTTMPEISITLKAVWRAKIVFDVNGGTSVSYISAPEGTSITLPAPEKDGFIFAGWYTKEGMEFSTKVMPSVGIKLYAKYYKLLEYQSQMVYVDNANSFDWKTAIGHSCDEKFYNVNATVTFVLDFDAKDQGDWIFEGSDKWWIEIRDSTGEDYEVLASTTIKPPKNNYKHITITMKVDSSKIGAKNIYFVFNRGNSFGSGYVKNLIMYYSAADTSKLY